MAPRRPPSARSSRQRATRSRPPRLRPSRPTSIVAFASTLTAVPLAEPSAAISCASPVVQKTGSIKQYNGAYTHTGPDYVIFMSPGFGFGGSAAVTYQKIADGVAFEGSHQFCSIKKCSNGAPSNSTTSLKGTVTTQTGISTLEMSYEVLAFCGTEIVCIEEGTFTGTKVSSGLDPLNATFNGKVEWTLTCCPDVQWKASVEPV